MILLIVETASIVVLGMLVSVPVAFWQNSFWVLLIGMAITLSLAGLHVRRSRRMPAATTIEGLIARAILSLAGATGLALTLLGAFYVANYSETPQYDEASDFLTGVLLLGSVLMVVAVIVLYGRALARHRNGTKI